MEESDSEVTEVQQAVSKVKKKFEPCKRLQKLVSVFPTLCSVSFLLSFSSPYPFLLLTQDLCFPTEFHRFSSP